MSGNLADIDSARACFDFYITIQLSHLDLACCGRQIDGVAGRNGDLNLGPRGMDSCGTLPANLD